MKYMTASHVTLFDRLRDAIYARYERLFPTPVQVRLIEILGGTTFTIGAVRRNNRPLTLTLSRGRLLRSRRFRRRVVDGTGALANDIKWAVMIQGPEYERDVLAVFERDEKLEAQGWRLAYVTARDIWNRPDKVRQNLLPFFAS
jgi:very-short-patch-repair endonuclease